MVAEKTSTMVTFVLTTSSGESYPPEVPAVMGGKEIVEAFLKSLGTSLEQPFLVNREQGFPPRYRNCCEWRVVSQ